MLNKMTLKEFKTLCCMPDIATDWLKEMSEGDTFILGKCLVQTKRRYHRAQAIIQKKNSEWSYTAIWQFPNVYDPATIFTTGTIEINDSQIYIKSTEQDDFAMFLEVVRRLEIHSSTLSAEDVNKYIAFGYRPLYACLWIGADNVTKSAQFVNGEKKASRSKFKPSFIDVVMNNEQSQFEFFSGRTDKKNSTPTMLYAPQNSIH